MVKLLSCLLAVLCGTLAASAQTPVTYKCWCTLHGGAEREYTIPGNVYQEATLPIELPDYGRVVCTVTRSDADKTQPQGDGAASLSVSLACTQQVQATKEGGYAPVLIMSAGFVPVYNKRIAVLDTPAYSISIELIKG